MPTTRRIARMYGQVVDPSGQPAASVGLVLLRVKDQAALGNAVSDSNGAFILAFDIPEPSEDKYEIRLSINKNGIALSELSQVPEGPYGPLIFVAERRPPGRQAGVAPKPTLLGDEETVIEAFKRAPHLFTRPTSARPPDPCSPYTQSEIPARVFALNQLMMFPRKSRTDGGGNATVTRGTEEPQLGNDLRYGVIMMYRQEWWDMGFALGDLLYSVPLAPCEQTKIATVDWRRQDYALRQTALDESHFQDTTIKRNEVVSELARLISDKDITGITGGSGMGYTIGPFSGGSALTISNVHEAVGATTIGARSLNDRIQQTSNTLRNTRAVAIAEVTQAEESTVRTRTIRNHNHCHTVTFQYFEVLRHFLLATKLSDVRPAVFVPFSIPQFTLALVLKYAYVLRRALLDPTLESTFNTLLGISQPQAEGAPAAEPTAESLLSPASEPPISEFQIRAQIPGAQGGLIPAPLTLSVNDESSTVQFQPAVAGPAGAEVGTAQPPSANLQLSDIERIGIGSKSDVTLDDLVIRAKVGTQYREVLFEPSVHIESDHKFARKVRAGSAVTQASSAGTTQNPGLTRLLDHLNAYPTHYTAALIAGGDAGMRYLALSDITDANGNSLADIVDNSVIGVVGNYAAFQLSGREHMPAGTLGPGDEAEWPRELPRAAQERLITLPTPGVFAESQLGSCSACEKIDLTRFWDWQKSPCPDEAPDITAEMLSSRFRDLKDLVSVITSSLQPVPVQIPERPEPMIKIGDETMKELVKGLSLPDAQSVLEFIQGLAGIGSEHSLEVFKTIWSTYTGSAATGAATGSGAGGETGAAAGAGLPTSGAPTPV